MKDGERLKSITTILVGSRKSRSPAEHPGSVKNLLSFGKVLMFSAVHESLAERSGSELDVMFQRFCQPMAVIRVVVFNRLGFTRRIRKSPYAATARSRGIDTGFLQIRGRN